MVVTDPGPTAPVVVNNYGAMGPYGWQAYPWWSMDWFYLGFGYRDPYVAWHAHRVYGYPYYSLYYPWYGWSPTYAWGHPWYPAYDSAWCPPGWRYPDLHGRPPVRLASDFAFTPRTPASELGELPNPGERLRVVGDDFPREVEERRNDARFGDPVRAYDSNVLIRSFGNDSDTGMIVRSRGNQKPSRSRTEPVFSRPVSPSTAPSPLLPPQRTGALPRQLEPVARPGTTGPSTTPYRGFKPSTGTPGGQRIPRTVKPSSPRLTSPPPRSRASTAPRSRPAPRASSRSSSRPSTSRSAQPRSSRSSEQ